MCICCHLVCTRTECIACLYKIIRLGRKCLARVNAHVLLLELILGTGLYLVNCHIWQKSLPVTSGVLYNPGMCTPQVHHRTSQAPVHRYQDDLYKKPVLDFKLMQPNANSSVQQDSVLKERQ